MRIICDIDFGLFTSVNTGREDQYGQGATQKFQDASQAATATPRANRKRFMNLKEPILLFGLMEISLRETTHTSLGISLSRSASTSPPSQLVNPGLVMLDGSTMAIADTGSDKTSKDNPTRKFGNLLQHSIESRPSPPEPIEENREEHNTKQLSPPSLRKRLAGKFSQSYLEHISSVLQYSSPSSLGSSLLSATQTNSWMSGQWSMNKESPNSTFPAVGTSFSEESVVASDPTSSRLPKNQQTIWDELVDESMLSLPINLIVRPDYNFLSHADRECCTSSLIFEWQDFQGVCATCGYTKAHRLQFYDIAECLRVNRSPWQYAHENYLGVRDHFDNTPLHCAAAAGHIHILEYFVTLAGDRILGRNTSGETFAHLLCVKDEKVNDLVKLLRGLQSVFGERWFSTCRDYHGRTIIHKLLQHGPDQMFDPKVLVQLFESKSLDLQAADNFGVTLRGILTTRLESRHDPWLQEFEQSRVLFSIYDKGIPTVGSTGQIHNFQKRGRPCKTFGEIFSSWPMPSYDAQNLALTKMIGAGMEVNWVDVEGETALISIIKHWTDANSELELRLIVFRLVALGAEIHMRDRSGNTAIAAAAARGFRAVMTLLLDQGANIHNRNYAGLGILTQASRWKKAAKVEKDETLYARIWSCLLLLIDRGAKHDPTILDEWMSASGKESFSHRIPTTSLGTEPISIQNTRGRTEN
jgi:ankyrin repeat protein